MCLVAACSIGPQGLSSHGRMNEFGSTSVCESDWKRLASNRSCYSALQLESRLTEVGGEADLANLGLFEAQQFCLERLST
jgi:hypothetical protein